MVTPFMKNGTTAIVTSDSESTRTELHEPICLRRPELGASNQQRDCRHVQLERRKSLGPITNDNVSAAEIGRCLPSLCDAVPKVQRRSRNARVARAVVTATIAAAFAVGGNTVPPIGPHLPPFLAPPPLQVGLLGTVKCDVGPGRLRGCQHGLPGG